MAFCSSLKRRFASSKLMPGCISRKCLKSSGTPSPLAKPCSSGMFPPSEGDENRIPAPCDDDAGDCFVANCRWNASGIVWSEGYVRLITGQPLSKSYHIQWLIGTTPPKLQILLSSQPGQKVQRRIKFFRFVRRLLKHVRLRSSFQRKDNGCLSFSPNIFSRIYLKVVHLYRNIQPI